MCNSITTEYNLEVFSVIHLLELWRFFVGSSGWTSSLCLPHIPLLLYSCFLFLFLHPCVRRVQPLGCPDLPSPSLGTDKVSVHLLLRTRKLAQQQRQLKLNSSLVTRDFSAIWNVKYRNVKKKKKKRGNELKCVCRAHELVIVPVKARRIILLPFLFPFYSCCILNVWFYFIALPTSLCSWFNHGEHFLFCVFE